jgi:hypothetical protein
MSKRSYTVEVLWCGNTRRGLGWQFPPAVKRRLQEDFQSKSILHLFGGRSTFGTRLDMDPVVKPDVIGDAWLPPFARESFDVVILDPPYFHMNLQMKNALFRAAGWIAREHVVWFHTLWSSASQGLKADRAFLVRVGDTCACRCLQYYRVVERPGPVKNFNRGPAMKYNRWLAQPEVLPGAMDVYPIDQVGRPESATPKP